MTDLLLCKQPPKEKLGVSLSCSRSGWFTGKQGWGGPTCPLIIRWDLFNILVAFRVVFLPPRNSSLSSLHQNIMVKIFQYHSEVPCFRVQQLISRMEGAPILNPVSQKRLRWWFRTSGLLELFSCLFRSDVAELEVRLQGFRNRNSTPVVPRCVSVEMFCRSLNATSRIHVVVFFPSTMIEVMPFTIKAQRNFWIY